MAAQLNPEEVEAFASGLFYLANVDGIDETERTLIVEFLRETESDLTIEKVAESKVNPYDIADMLDTAFQRRIFMRAAIALVHADGKYTDAERHAIGEFADAFGFNNAEFGDIEQEAKRLSIQ